MSENNQDLGIMADMPKGCPGCGSQHFLNPLPLVYQGNWRIGIVCPNCNYFQTVFQLFDKNIEPDTKRHTFFSDDAK